MIVQIASFGSGIHFVNPPDLHADNDRWRALNRQCPTPPERDNGLIEFILDQSRSRSRGDREQERGLYEGLRQISGLLLAQCRSGPSDVAVKLAVAAGRAVILAHVHRRRRPADEKDTVELRHYVRDLCEDLSALFLNCRNRKCISVEGADVEALTAFAIPLGLIVNELIVNALKHGAGDIQVRIASIAPALFSLAVVDQGEGFPENFDPANGGRQGMKIVLALVRQMGGSVQFLRGGKRRGACVALMCNTL
jgi:two-component sensor histidine kinase